MKVNPLFSSVVHPLILELYENYFITNTINDYDFVAVIILIYLSVEQPTRYLSGKLNPPIIDAIVISNSLSIVELPQTILDTLNISYIQRKFKISCCENVRVMDIFNNFQLYGIKKNINNFVNQSLVNWALGDRLFDLMFNIPEPMDVLKQQAYGRRVITVFKEKNELESYHIANLYYMKGQDNHAKNSFEFTLHDLKHMESFACKEIYNEQIGFCRCFLNLGYYHVLNFFKDINFENKDLNYEVIDKRIHPLCLPWDNDVLQQPIFPKKFFYDILNLDKLLWKELEYVISDMNCFSTHLVRYLMAKLLSAIDRCKKDVHTLQFQYELYWKLLLLGFGISPIVSESECLQFISLDASDINPTYNHLEILSHNAYIGCMSMLEKSLKLLDGKMTEVEGESLRAYFRYVGNFSIK